MAGHQPGGLHRRGARDDDRHRYRDRDRRHDRDGRGGHIWELTLAHLNQVPAVLVLLGAAALLFGALPQAIPATWAIVGYGLIVGTFGAMLDLPQTVLNVSPYTHAAQMPVEPFAIVPVLILTLVGAAAAGLGLLTFRRRGYTVT